MPIGLKSILGLIRLQLSAILDFSVYSELVRGDFARELLGVAREQKGEDACQGESSDSGTLEPVNVMLNFPVKSNFV